MRKALMAVLMAATAVSTVAPAAAEAQQRIGHRKPQAERQEQRQEQRAARQQERASQPQQPRRIGGQRIGTTPTARAEQAPVRIGRDNPARVEGNRDRNWGRDRDRNGDRDGRHDARNGNRRDGVRIGSGNDRRGNDRWERRSDRRDVRDWSRSWRNDRRYDWQRYRYSNRNAYRVGRYYAPYRHNYSRFSIGFFLGQPFYGSRYWINDPWQYRLPPAYAGTRWVRYYDDVLLVDMYSGEVIDVIYDFFW
ncbi:RcnB family protein [Allosphingosinicella vermicomposti]|uniref:RcnB family protein n=1 Tax=Allosphingosinicella vermicomposti TaxID=614671 RepID=UPI001FDED578|nr:RcnB family protein [Allosphingosinicella vermicomposti]